MLKEICKRQVQVYEEGMSSYKFHNKIIRHIEFKSDEINSFPLVVLLYSNVIITLSFWQ